ncbi:hypothetical protein [uncultured Maricaulis sp.]|uniref:hypothetical protein n=1 Tax=uncultured Maricaulis sp. TaxID=174710 RepID=UPI0030DBC71F
MKKFRRFSLDLLFFVPVAQFSAAKESAGVGRRQQVNPQSRDNRNAAVKLLQLLTRRSTGFIAFAETRPPAPGIGQACPLLQQGLPGSSHNAATIEVSIRAIYCRI